MKRTLYPMTKFAIINTLGGQIGHIRSEIAEFEAASRYVEVEDQYLGVGRPSAQSLAMFRELADVQAAIETLWHVLDRLFGAGFSEKMVMGWVEDKNRRRGYYQGMKNSHGEDLTVSKKLEDLK